jgi:hypothetical protein
MRPVLVKAGAGRQPGRGVDWVAWHVLRRISCVTHVNLDHCYVIL